MESKAHKKWLAKLKVGTFVIANHTDGVTQHTCLVVTPDVKERLHIYVDGYPRFFSLKTGISLKCKHPGSFIITKPSKKEKEEYKKFAKLMSSNVIINEIRKKWLADIKVGDVAIVADHWGEKLAFIRKVCKAYVRIGNMRYSRKTGNRMGYKEEGSKKYIDKPLNEEIIEFKTEALRMSKKIITKEPVYTHNVKLELWDKPVRAYWSEEDAYWKGEDGVDYDPVYIFETIKIPKEK